MSTITLTVPDEIAQRLAEDPALLDEAAALLVDVFAPPSTQTIDAVRRGFAQYEAGEWLSLEESQKRGQATLGRFLAKRRARKKA